MRLFFCFVDRIQMGPKPPPSQMKFVAFRINVRTWEVTPYQPFFFLFVKIVHILPPPPTNNSELRLLLVVRSVGKPPTVCAMHPLSFVLWSAVGSKKVRMLKKILTENARSSLIRCLKHVYFWLACELSFRTKPILTQSRDEILPYHVQWHSICVI